MSAVTSAATGRRYGVERVCAAWELPRSSYYAFHEEQEASSDRQESLISQSRRRGPVPAISDEDLLAAIRNDLKRSPFSGEGHRKVWARLRRLDNTRVSRKRVLRLMREHHLLSPHRCRVANDVAHDGTITTDAPDLMWGTDGVRVFTLEQGWVWIFSAVDHWSAECIGAHVAKLGDRFAALEPISTGLTRIFGGVDADIARGLSLRMDHGSQYLSDHFLNQIRFWGIQPSFAFVREPQTNGVAERFNRTLKEQIIHGCIYQNVEELRAAVVEFVETYNHHWRIEKRGFLTPVEAREAYALQSAA
jgi:transposase InsO family protein